MPYKRGPGARQDLTNGRNWAILLAIVALGVGLAFAFGGSTDMPPGCRMVGKVRQCDPAPSPSPSTSDPLAEYDDGIGDGIGDGTDGDGLDDELDDELDDGGLDDNPYSDL
ncbi:hypothetical protein [Streptomyces sp. NPDC048172]|uniref:hypothetical protein n=1 Tax=Streptomyces sp. NPDC048172 TaxID=3365505 RepID=UPI00371FF26C